MSFQARVVSSPRPRPDWRRVLVAGLGLLLVVGVIAAVQFFLAARLSAVWFGVVMSLAVLATYYGHARFIERRDPVELALPALPQAIWGMLLGAALFCATLLGLAAFGAYHLVGRSAFSIDPPNALALGLMGAIIEETLFRGYLFRWIAGFNAWLAIAVSAAVFGGLHGLNHGATVFSSVAIALEAGVLLSAAYLVSGNLWFPIGIHFGWNFTEGPIFNVPISGNPTPGLMLGSLQGPDWLTGGAFGVEASVVAIVVCLVAAALLLARVAARAGRGFTRL